MLNIFKKIEKPSEALSAEELYNNTKDTIKSCAVITASCAAFAGLATGLTAFGVAKADTNGKKAAIAAIGSITTILEASLACAAYKRLDEAIDVHDVTVVHNMWDAISTGKFSDSKSEEEKDNV